MGGVIWPPFLLSLEVTAVATVIVVLLGVPLGLLLARARFPGKTALETSLLLPMVLPPSVAGYYLLLLLGRHGPIQAITGVNLLFTWKAAVIASVVVGLPLMVQAAKAAVASVDPVLEDAARTLGASELSVFFRVTLPLARRGIVAGTVLAATRGFGEFGATLMIAGDIPGVTQTLPLAVYDAVQARSYDQANLLVLIMTLSSFGSLFLLRRLEARW